MKESRSQIDKLIVARTIFQLANTLSNFQDKYSATAALILLQDAYELVLVATYDKLIDTNIPEKITFDNLHKEVVDAIGGIACSQEMYGMNKARVNAKHYGVLSESTTTLNFIEASKQAIEKMCQKAFNRSFSEIGLLDLVPDCESKEFLLSAKQFMDKPDLFLALVEIRKAIFIEFEKDYSVYEWRQTPNDTASSLMLSLKLSKAPYYCMDKDWIEKNVKEPFDYIQIDPRELRYELLELGIAPADYWSIRRLTPQVTKFEKSGNWSTGIEDNFLDGNDISYEDVNFCFDIATEMIFKKKLYKHKHKSRESQGKSFLKLTSQKNLHTKADTKSEIIKSVGGNNKLIVQKVVSGLEAGRFYNVYEFDKEAKKIFEGYVVLDENDSFVLGTTEEISKIFD
ncbi:MAG: hypothetical protein JSR85_08190 [Proteobacteria bacterium]|nr:hypothetical protein [Pseudomonadota bacterium]